METEDKFAAIESRDCGHGETIEILKIIDPGTYWIKECSFANESISQHEKKLSGLQFTLCNEMNIPRTVVTDFYPNKDQLVAARHNLVWKRGIVEHLNLTRATGSVCQCKLFLVDYGVHVTVSMSQVRQIPDWAEADKIPFIGFKVALYGLKPLTMQADYFNDRLEPRVADKWDDAVLGYVKNLFHEASKIRKVLVNPTDTPSVRIYLHFNTDVANKYGFPGNSDCVCLNHLLVHKRSAVFEEEDIVEEKLNSDDHKEPPRFKAFMASELPERNSGINNVRATEMSNDSSFVSKEQHKTDCAQDSKRVQSTENDWSSLKEFRYGNTQKRNVRVAMPSGLTYSAHRAPPGSKRGNPVNAQEAAQKFGLPIVGNNSENTAAAHIIGNQSERSSFCPSKSPYYRSAVTPLAKGDIVTRVSKVNLNPTKQIKPKPFHERAMIHEAKLKAREEGQSRPEVCVTKESPVTPITPGSFASLCQPQGSVKQEQQNHCTVDTSNKTSVKVQTGRLGCLQKALKSISPVPHRSSVSPPSTSPGPNSSSERVVPTKSIGRGILINMKASEHVGYNETQVRQVESNDSPQLKNDELYGYIPPQMQSVLVQGDNPPARVFDISQIPFDGALHKVLENMHVQNPRELQASAWLSELRRRNSVIIAPKSSGKTLTAVAPILNILLQPEQLKELPVSHGPVAIIMCRHWTAAQTAFRLCKYMTDLLREQVHSKTPIVKLMSLAVDDKDVMQLINGCEILVATAVSLHSVLHRQAPPLRVLDLSRLSYLVLKEADQLLKEQGDYVTELLEELHTKVHIKPKMTCISRRWDPILGTFLHSTLNRPLLYIDSPFEAICYGRVKTFIHFINGINKMEVTDEIVQMNDKPGCIIIVAKDDNVGSLIYEAIKSQGCPNLYFANSTLEFNQHEELKNSVYNDLNYSHQCVVITTDETLSTIDFKCTSVLIHYDIPFESKNTFGRRYFCMQNNFWSAVTVGKLIQDKEPKCTSHVLITPEELERVPRIINTFHQLAADIPPEINQFIQNLAIQRDSCETKLLCELLKATGRCDRVLWCPGRHMILKDVDINPKIPAEGTVLMRIQLVRNPTQLYGKLCATGKTTNYSDDKGVTMLFKMASYLKIYDNRVPVDNVGVGDVCALLSTEDQCFYRVRLLRQVPHTEKWEVLYMDVGLHEDVFVKRLLKLPEEFQVIAPQITEIQVLELLPSDREDTWSEQAIAAVKDIFKINTHIRAEVLLSCNNTLFVHRVRPCTRLDNGEIIEASLLKKTLINGNYAEENPDHIPSLVKLFQKSGVPCKNAERAIAMMSPLQSKISNVEEDILLNKALDDYEQSTNKAASMPSVRPKSKTPTSDRGNETTTSREVKGINKLESNRIPSPQQFLTSKLDESFKTKSQMEPSTLHSQDICTPVGISQVENRLEPRAFSPLQLKCRPQNMCTPTSEAVPVKSVTPSNLNTSKLQEASTNSLNCETQMDSSSSASSITPVQETIPTDLHKPPRPPTPTSSTTGLSSFQTPQVQKYSETRAFSPMQLKCKSPIVRTPTHQSVLDNENIPKVQQPHTNSWDLECLLKDSSESGSSSSMTPLRAITPTDLQRTPSSQSSYSPQTTSDIESNRKLRGIIARRGRRSAEPPLAPTITKENMKHTQVDSMGGLLVVYVSYVVTPHLFYVNLHDQATSMDKLEEDMIQWVQSKESVPSPNHKWRVNDMCIGAIPEYPDEWNRAEITDISPEGYKLFYVDHGDSEVVPEENLRLIHHKHIQLPVQAIECSISHIVPMNESWDESVCIYFKELTREKDEDRSMSQLQMDVICGTSVKLYLPIGEIGDVMIQNQMALSQTDVDSESSMSMRLGSSASGGSSVISDSGFDIVEHNGIAEKLKRMLSTTYGMNVINQIFGSNDNTQEGPTITEVVGTDPEPISADPTCLTEEPVQWRNWPEERIHHPEVRWGQNIDTLYLTIKVLGVRQYFCQPRRKGFRVSAMTDNVLYVVDEDLAFAIDERKCTWKYVFTDIEIKCCKLVKVNVAWPKLLSCAKKPTWLYSDHQHLMDDGDEDLEDREPREMLPNTASLDRNKVSDGLPEGYYENLVIKYSDEEDSDDEKSRFGDE